MQVHASSSEMQGARGCRSSLGNEARVCASYFCAVCVRTECATQCEARLCVNGGHWVRIWELAWDLARAARGVLSDSIRAAQRVGV